MAVEPPDADKAAIDTAAIAPPAPSMPDGPARPSTLFALGQNLLASLLIPLAAAGLQKLLWGIISPYVWFFFFPAVFLSSWISNVFSGLAATLVSILLVFWFFVPPVHSWLKPGLAAYLSSLMFLGMGIVFCLSHERLRRANSRVNSALEDTRVANVQLQIAKEQAMQLYEKTRELDELKSQFFANVSHELRTPLTLILGPVERMLSEPDLRETQRSNLELIERQARGLLAQINALLDVSKLKAGKMTVAYCQTDLAELVRLATANFEALALERQISFDVQAPPTLPAQVDAEKIMRILLNLLSNAFKFTPPGGKISCALSLEDESSSHPKARLVVTDTGPGIPPELTEKIFERFYQVEGAATRRYEGTGLGLAIAKEFAELHGGSISASNAPGGGAVFSLQLPLAAPSGSLVAEASLPATPTSLQVPQVLFLGKAPGEKPVERRDDTRPLVLIVEDNPDMNRFISESLAEDFRTACAWDGQDGLQKVLELKPDLVLSDIMMPRMSGDQMFHAIRSHHEFDRIPIILLTAKADDPLKLQLLREGAQDYLTKPFAMEELLARVRNLTTRKRVEEALATREAELKHSLEMAQLKDHFLSTVSHELKTPLSIIAGYAELLQEKYDQDELVAGILDGSWRLSIHLSNIVDYQAILTGAMPLYKGEIVVEEIIRDVIEIEKPALSAHELELVTDLPAKSPLIIADSRRVSQMVMELLENAMKFTPKGGRVTIRVRSGEQHAFIEVEDTGPGLSPEEFSCVWEAFTQLNIGDTTRKGGLGLGLSIVKAIAELHGGSVEVQSKLGKGTRFTICLPATPESAEACN